MRLLASSNNKIILVFNVLITLLSPYISEELWRFLSLGRLALLWPIFYLGLKTDYEHMLRMRNNTTNSIFIGMFFIILEFILLYKGIVDVTWATHDYPTSISEILLKYIFMIFTIGCFVGIMAVVPEKSKTLNR